jgi:glucan biosynthesis protein
MRLPEFLIQPDSQTTPATVFTLLESLRASGAQRFEIIAEHSDTNIRSLATNAELVKRQEFQNLEPPK